MSLLGDRTKQVFIIRPFQSHLKLFFAFPKIISIFDPTNQIFLPLKGCLVFIKKGEEIRLSETLATNPENRENGAKT
jgi:hypothetical protein